MQLNVPIMLLKCSQFSHIMLTKNSRETVDTEPELFSVPPTSLPLVVAVNSPSLPRLPLPCCHCIIINDRTIQHVQACKASYLLVYVCVGADRIVPIMLGIFLYA